MEIKIVIASLILFNLVYVFPSSSSLDSVVDKEKTAASRLSDQVWDFADRRSNGEAIKLLANSHAVELTDQCHSRILDFLRTIPHYEVVEILDGDINPGQKFLKSLLLQVFPDHTDFWKFIRMSKKAESKSAAAAGLFGLMAHADTPLAVKRHAAEVASGVRDDDGKSYLDDTQLEQVRVILDATLNDESATYRDRHMASDELFYTFNADHTGRLGTETQRKAAVAVVFGLGQRMDAPDEIRVNFLMNALMAPLRMSWEFKCLETDEQRRLVLQIIIDSPKTDLRFITWARANGGTLLATPDQRAQALEIMYLRIREGGVAQKFAAAEAIINMDDEFVCEKVKKEKLDSIKKEAVSACYRLFDSSELLPDERFLAFSTVARFTGAEDEMRKEAISRMVLVTKGSKVDNGKGFITISDVLFAKDKHGNSLATTDQRKEMAEYGVLLLSDDSLSVYVKHGLANNIFIEDTFSRCATDTQLQVTLPFLLDGKFLDNPGRELLMRNVLTRKTEDGSTYLATTPQRQKALEILAGFMNDTSKKMSERKVDAKAILDTVDTVPDSDAMKAAATVVMALADE